MSTIYVRNIDERIKLDRLKSQLRRRFEQFGQVIDVVAHKNIRLRGQAFVVFDNPDQAKQALEAMNQEEFHGKPLVIQLSNQPSDATVKKAGATEFEEHKNQRFAAKEERKQHLPPSKPNKRAAKKDKKALGDRPKKQQKKQVGAGAAMDSMDATGASSRLPRNKVLFLENLPPTITEETLVQIFSAFPGFSQVRLVAIRRVGFVEYDADDQAAIAREATMGLVNDDHTIKITYAKK